MSARNRLQLIRSSIPGKVPTLSDLLQGELALNIADNDLYVNMGAAIIQLNHASNIKTDATHRFVTDAQIASLTTGATTSSLGLVQIGSNINVDGNGVISLDVADATHTGVLSSTDWATFMGKQDDIGYTPVNVAGDTMLGTLVLNGGPTADNDAANKFYVDQLNATAVHKGGDTMSGLLILSADPAQGLGAATKQYVDNSISNIAGEYAAPVQNLVDLKAIPIATLQDKQLRLVEDTGAIFRFDDASTDTVDGDGVVAPDDVGSSGRWIKVQAATQSHDMLNGLHGGAPGDYVHLTTPEKNGYDAHLADMNIHLTTGQHNFLAAINATATELNYSIGVTSSIQTQLDGKQASLGYTAVNKGGDAMLGILSLFAAPVAAMDAVNLEYLETYVIDCGTF